MEVVLRDDVTVEWLVGYNIPRSVAAWFLDKRRQGDEPPLYYLDPEHYFFRDFVQRKWTVPHNWVEKPVTEDLPD